MTEDITMYAIYDHPKDYPNDFVVRRWRAIRGQPIADVLPTAVCKDLETARNLIPTGLVQIPRSPSDDPVILETWL